MAQPQTIIATWLVGVVEQLSRRGIDPAQLDAGAWSGDLGQVAPTRQLQMVHARRLWQRAMQLSGDPLLGLDVGAALPLQAMNIVALVLMHSGSLRQALAHTVRLQQLVSNSGRFQARSSRDGGVQLEYHVNPSPVAMHPAQIDSVFAAYLGFLYRCVPSGLRPLRVELPGTDERLVQRYETLFGCPVTLRASQPCVLFDAATLDQPWHAADPALLRMLLGRAEAALQSQGRADALIDHVSAAIAAQGYASVSCDSVACALNLSTRTLQRRLTECGTRFRQLVEAARMDEALQGLADPALPLATLADRLGYAEPSAFSHAVRGHFGMSPRALRAELTGRPVPAGAEARQEVKPAKAPGA
jgi:AraC-like DNA-binding protein